MIGIVSAVAGDVEFGWDHVNDVVEERIVGKELRVKIIGVVVAMLGRHVVCVCCCREAPTEIAMSLDLKRGGERVGGGWRRAHILSRLMLSPKKAVFFSKAFGTCLELLHKSSNAMLINTIKLEQTIQLTTRIVVRVPDDKNCGYIAATLFLILAAT